MPTSVLTSALTQAIAGASDNDVVQVKDGKIATARRSFFGRILRFLPTSARETRDRQAAAEIVTHSLLVDLKEKFDKTPGGQYIAETAMRAVGLGEPGQTQAGRNAPITVRQIREAHACAKLLSDRAQRSAAILAAVGYSPAAPGFDKFAREQAGVDPARLTESQRVHYQYMLHKHVGMEPAKYVGDSAAVQKLAIRALKYVSGMSNAQIDTAQNDTLTQRNAAAAVVKDLTSGAGVSSLAANLDRLHDAIHLGLNDAMLGDPEFGSHWTLECIALERVVGTLTPQQARDAYFKAMASDGAGRVVLAALDENADKLSEQSLRSGKLADETQLDHASKRARELHSTTRLVLEALGRRGGVENLDRQLDDVSRRGPERRNTASGAFTVIGKQLDRAVTKKLRETQSTSSGAPNISEGEGILIPAGNERLGKTLRKEDSIPAKTRDGRPVRQVSGPAGESTEVFGNAFYQDMDRMQILLEGNGTQTRIGAVATSEHDATEEEKEAAKLDGLDRLVEFVGDEALAARVTRLVEQKLFTPMSRELENPDCPVRLADGSHGQMQAVPGTLHRAVTLSKEGNGEIGVHVELSYAPRAMTSPESIRHLDGERSHLRMSYDFNITRDDVRVTSPVTYDFRLAEAE